MSSEFPEAVQWQLWSLCPYPSVILLLSDKNMINNQIYEINPNLLSQFETDRCILCMNESEKLTPEHIIPESIGGTFKPKILCERCNKTIGSKIHSELAKNMSIQIAIQNLKGDLPELFKKFEYHSEYVGVTESGLRTQMRMDKKGKLKTKTTIKSDGSIIYDNNDVLNHIKNILKKEGYPQREISDLIEKHSIAPTDKKITLVPGLDFIKHEHKNVEKHPTGEELSPKVSLIILYEFLALILGERINDEKFNDIRDCLLNEGEIPKTVIINDFSTFDDYLPIHQIEFYYDEQEKCVFGVVIFFNWLVYTVHFKVLECMDYYPRFNFDLTNGKTFFNYTLKEKTK